MENKTPEGYTHHTKDDVRYIIENKHQPISQIATFLNITERTVQNIIDTSSLPL